MKRVAADRTVTVRSGVTTIVQSFASLNPETCGWGALPIMKVVQPPAHGSVTFEKYQQVIDAGTCAGKTVRSMATVHRSAAGYHGTDTFAIDGSTELWVNGVGMRDSRSTFTIVVK